MIAEPVPEEDCAGEFEGSVPFGGALAGCLRWGEEVDPAQTVEVEAAEAEKWVVQVCLVFDCPLCYCVEVHDSVVVRGSETVEEAVADGEEGHVFNVGVVFGGVGDDVMDVVVSFPPAYAEAAEEVGDEDADTGVYVEGVGYAHVTRIVGGEDKLMPEETEEETC